MTKLKRKLSSAVYHLRSSYLRFYLYMKLCNINEININSPIFILGTQGGGLTLTARMLWRNQSCVSVLGNSRWWNGSPEMQNALGPILPERMRLRGSKGEERMFEEGLEEPWIYATDKYVPYFRVDSDNINVREKRRVRQVVRSILMANSKHPNSKRFVCKSQSYTLKVSYINEIFERNAPHFLLVNRNPYVLCYRAAKKVYRSVYKRMSTMEKIRIACQHWRNSVMYCLDDAQKIDNFLSIKFENIIRKTEKVIKKVCSHTGLRYTDRMVPSGEDVWPFGGLNDNKWYPLRNKVNEKYLKEMKPEHVRVIKKECGELAQKVGYEPPKIK